MYGTALLLTLCVQNTLYAASHWHGAGRKTLIVTKKLLHIFNQSEKPLWWRWEIKYQWKDTARPFFNYEVCMATVSRHGNMATEAETHQNDLLYCIDSGKKDYLKMARSPVMIDGTNWGNGLASEEHWWTSGKLSGPNTNVLAFKAFMAQWDIPHAVIKINTDIHTVFLRKNKLWWTLSFS